MTVEKFDGTFSRCASVVTLLQTIPTIASVIVLYQKGKVSLAEVLWYASGFVLLTAFILYLIYWFLCHYKKTQLDSAAKRASQFDYKYCSEIMASGIHKFLCGESACNIDLDSLSSEDPIFIPFSEDSSKYRKASDFYSDDEIMKSFECRPLKNRDKENKCILQVLYIPSDADGNVPVILRMPDQHTSAGEDKPKFTFVSFSPVPRRYGAKFDALDCYRREVPSAPMRLDEYGMALSKQGSSYYLFHIFFARYDHLHFVRNGVMDRSVVEEVFSVGDGKMFAKDHDEILHATTFKNLYRAVTRQTCEDEFLKRLMKGGRTKFTRLEEGKPYITFSFDLSKAEFKGIEKKIVETEGRKNS